VRLGTGKGKYRNPVRVVLDPHLRVSAGSNVFDGESSSIIFYDRRLLANKYKRKLDILCEKGVDTINVASTNGEFNFSSLMHILGKKGISSVLVEGGGETHALALKYRAADEINAFIAPKIVGGRDAKTPVEGEGIAKMAKALLFKGIEVEKVGPDLLIRGYF
jgi:diaminohydroxyphosphoribosylaminopyrimidine deaminase/5-amino-6-(5-phosphoribosylamino)uracil reductase